jgi:hypothetical protein
MFVRRNSAVLSTRPDWLGFEPVVRSLPGGFLGLMSFLAGGFFT